MRSLFLALALVAGIVFPVTGAAAAPSQGPSGAPAGSLGIRLLDAPTSAAQDPRAQTYVVDHLPPGGVIHRRVEVSNTSASAATVAVYPAAAAISNGVFTPEGGHAENDVSSWTTTDHPSVAVPPGGSSTVTMTIDVPRDAPPGEGYAVLWAEEASPAPPGGGVSLVNRVGIRIYLSVGPGGAPPSSFTIDSVTAQRSPTAQPVVLVHLHNTGGRALDVTGSLKLSDGPAGLSAGPFAVQGAATLAPGDAGQVTVPLDRNLPDGPWLAVIDLRSGLVEQTSQATIQFPHGAGAAAPVGARDTGGSPWSLVGVLSLLLVLVAASVVVVRYRRSRNTDAAEPEHSPHP